MTKLGSIAEWPVPTDKRFDRGGETWDLEVVRDHLEGTDRIGWRFHYAANWPDKDHTGPYAQWCLFFDTHWGVNK
jgi:hypothetical protein